MSTPERLDIGLYQQKYRLRRLLDRIPGIGRLNPNAVSLASLLPSILAAWAFSESLWALAIAGIVGRMILSTLDGLVAEGYGKKSALGAYLNRVPAEFGDVLILGAFVAQTDPRLVVALVAGAWLVNVFGVLGLVAGAPGQSVGPAGQTDRLALLLLANFSALFTPVHWDAIAGILIALMAITVALRIRRTIRALRSA